MTRSPGALAIRLRCRHLPGIRFEERSGDVFFGQDPAFFTNIHPNSRCLALIAEWETAALKQAGAAGVLNVVAQRAAESECSRVVL